MAEIWKNIEGYDYKVSNTGIVINSKGKIINGRKISINNGYIRVCLYKNLIGKDVSIHRLVAQAFIPNPDNKPQVNHKNGIKDDNRIENLEWCTASENIQHAYRTGLLKSTEKNFFKTNHPFKGKSGKEHNRSKKVYQYSFEGNLIKIWDSITEASKYYGLKSLSNITNVCLGKRKTAKGFIWHFN